MNITKFVSWCRIGRWVLGVWAASTTLAWAVAGNPYDALLDTARMLEASGNLAAAQQTAIAAVAVAPQRHEAHLLAGQLARKQGAEAEAQVQLAAALSLAPEAQKAEIQTLLAAGEAVLSPEDQRVLGALRLIGQEAEAAAPGEEKRRLFAEFVNRSTAFVRSHTNYIDLWRWRAVAALELNRPKVGREAAQHLLAIKAPDDRLRVLLAQLERKAWTTVVRVRTSLPAGSGAPADWAGKPLKVGATGIKLVWIAPGTFKMGTTQFETNGPQVTITRGFWIGETEVTQEQWEGFMGTNPSNFQQSRRSLERMAMTIIGDEKPVEQVSWFDATDFCRRLTISERSANRLPPGYEYRLPTEAEWEYACRAGSSGDYYAPELGRIAWYDKNSSEITHDVAGKKANAWGLHDMSGNVAEWCFDWSSALTEERYTDRAVLDADPDDRKGAVRMIRGGSWLNVPPRCQSAARIADDPNNALSYVGFRIALAPVVSPQTQ